MNKDLRALTTLLDNLPGVRYEVDQSARYSMQNNGHRHRSHTPIANKIVTVRNSDGSLHTVVHFSSAGDLKRKP